MNRPEFGADAVCDDVVAGQGVVRCNHITWAR